MSPIHNYRHIIKIRKRIVLFKCLNTLLGRYCKFHNCHHQPCRTASSWWSTSLRFLFPEWPSWSLWCSFPSQTVSTLLDLRTLETIHRRNFLVSIYAVLPVPVRNTDYTAKMPPLHCPESDHFLIREELHKRPLEDRTLGKTKSIFLRVKPFNIA